MAGRKLTRQDLSEAAEKYKNWGKWGPDDEVRPTQELLDARFDEPIDIGGKRLRIGASIGMARSDDFPGAPARLVQAADIALYRAKRNGPGNAELAIPTVRRAA